MTYTKFKMSHKSTVYLAMVVCTCCKSAEAKIAALLKRWKFNILTKQVGSKFETLWMDDGFLIISISDLENMYPRVKIYVQKTTPAFLSQHVSLLH